MRPNDVEESEEKIIPHRTVSLPGKIPVKQVVLSNESKPKTPGKQSTAPSDRKSATPVLSPTPRVKTPAPPIKKQNSPIKHKQAGPLTSKAHENSSIMHKQAGPSTPKAQESVPKVSTPIPEEPSDAPVDNKDYRLTWVERVLDKGVPYLVRRFHDNRKFKSTRATTTASDANRAKNRYGDIPCIDSTRVVLKGGSCDYIHANWIIARDGRRFICAQGPLSNTVADFWRMVLQEGCQTIVMLCKCKENGQEKTAPYFPTSVGSTLTIQNTSITLKKQTTTRFSNIMSEWSVKDGSNTITIRHINCTTWDDHTAPSDTAAAMEILKEISKSDSGRPVLVHCSAGIGRTCTLIGVILMLQRIKQGRGGSGVSLMKWMRERRLGAIQKGIQFVFLHRVVVEILCQDGVAKSSDGRVVAFEEKYQKLLVKQRKLLLAAKARKVIAPMAISELPVMKTQVEEDEEQKGEEGIHTARTQSASAKKCGKEGEKEEFLESEYADFL